MIAYDPEVEMKIENPAAEVREHVDVEATIAPLLRLGFNEGQVKKALKAVQGEIGRNT